MRGHTVCLSGPCTKALPPVAVMAGNLVNSVKDVTTGILQGDLKASSALYGARLATCKACAMFREDGKCSECGCIMVVKAWFERTSCPKSNW